MLFNQEYQNKLQAAWERFITGDDRDVDYSFIRPFIYESWLRSRNYKVEPFAKKTGILSPAEIAERSRKNSQLIRTVRPYIERLYSIVEGSGYFLLLSDKDGFVLDLIGDEEMIEHAKESLLVVGANRSEQIAGTNAIGTCLAIQTPIQIWNREHYVTSHRNYSCSSGPIFDENGNLLGCLNITGSDKEIHTHTLGMVLSAVDGITKEMQIQKAYDEIQSMSAQRNSILESVTSGLILVNGKDEITQINGNAQRMLRLNAQNAIGKNINSIISIDDPNETNFFSKLNFAFSDKEINVFFPDRNTAPVKFRMSVNFAGDGRDRGTVIRLEEAKYINKLVNKVGGFKASYTFDSIIGSSSAALALVGDCRRAANSSSNVLLLGDSGTGKELAAQSIHNASSCSDGPFVAINCAALPKSLIESELFGYEGGAFTGASKEGNPGKFELADGGTIFLDEIGDMPMDVQASLLRVIQTREIVRIGGKHPKKINVRIIAATNRNLADDIEAKTFRQDLYYRLNVLAINLPPLRDRGEDVCELADYFTGIFSRPMGRSVSISSEVYTALRRYPWPGNIRELENAIERAINITTDSVIRMEHLPSHILQRDIMPGMPGTPETPRMPGTPGTPETAWRAGLSGIPRAATTHGHQNPAAYHAAYQNQQPEDQYSLDYKAHGHQLILASLQQTNGNIKLAAELLGINRRTLYRKMEKYGIDYQNYRD